ncbi:MAG: cyclopropane-fatty-acyl-phospholipid synthase family protein [Thiobacillaceae bacterium]|jgi:cyclopropane-fatty-acyl-phospholipid synthase|nr:cyclopropane-fatty-acyl-phospholipid synthase family protein [Thiobacillaceae bacterium]
MTAAARLAIGWVEQGLVPDPVIRQGIRRLCRTRLEEIGRADARRAALDMQSFIHAMDAGPVAALPELANEQHYEVPAAFFEQVLGPRRKYSCCHWPGAVGDLAGAEEAALTVTCARAELRDGQDILELGCGWGSLSLWMAEHYPNARVTAVSNAQAQRRHIEAEAARRGLANLRVITADMNDYAAEGQYDRVVSVEMFEHMRNWGELLRRVAGWLRPGGRFFMHIFCHRDRPYLFEDRGPDDWMSRHFFSGGMMPSDDLPLRFQRDLSLLRQWRWSGLDYEKTANAWLANMDARRAAILPILADTYGADQAALWWQRWRLFFMACAETFAYDGGETWWVSHYLFERRT